MKSLMTREQKEKQIRREAKATLILFAICFVWNVGFAYGLSGTGARLFGLPVWWLISTPGMFIVAVVGVVILLKKVFVNFDLEDDEEGGDLKTKKKSYCTDHPRSVFIHQPLAGNTGKQKIGKGKRR